MMTERNVQNPLQRCRGDRLGVELCFHLESDEALLHLQRMLLGGVDDTSKQRGQNYLKLTQIPGMEFGYARATVSAMSCRPDHLIVKVSDLELLSRSVSEGERSTVDVGLGSAVAAAVKLAAFVHSRAELVGALLVREGNFGAGRSSREALTIESGWAEALGLSGLDGSHELRRVRWRDVHAFDAEAAVTALHHRRLAAAKVEPLM
jgi:hypothetical protein